MIVASGLVALVDDCIHERWQTSKKKTAHFPVLADMGTATKPRGFMQRVFCPRRASSSEHAHSPLRHASPISTF